MFLTSRTRKSNRKSLRLRLFACASIFTLLVTQMVLPGKAVVFAAGKVNAAPVSAPPEAFVTGSGGSTFSFVGLVGSVLEFIAPVIKKEAPETEYVASPAALSASAQSAPFMPSAGAFDLAKLRLNAKNATGGTDLYSQNFGWGTSLIGLSGRSGLDAGFGISYNSLVWLKDSANSEIIFDPDTSKVSPGFTMGFPDIEPAYYDTDKSVWVFLMLNPDGSRTEFCRVGSTDVFDAADSSYRQLVINPGGAPDGKSALIDMTVISTSGTRMHYIWRSQVRGDQGPERQFHHDQLHERTDDFAIRHARTGRDG